MPRLWEGCVSRIQLPAWLWWPLRVLCYPLALVWWYWPQCRAEYEVRRDTYNYCSRRRWHLGSHEDFSGTWVAS